MMNVLISAAVAMMLYLSGFATGWKVDTWKNTAENAAQVKAAQDMAAAQANWANTVATDFETKLANIKVVNRTINNEVRHEVEKTVYGDPNCNLPESGRLLRDRAIDAANTGTDPGGSAAAVPPNRQVDGADVRGRSVPSGPRTNSTVR